MVEEVKFQFDVLGWDGQVAKCGKWIASLAPSCVYSEGLVFANYSDDGPAYWGQGKTLLEMDNAMMLIDRVSKVMLHGLGCSLHKDCRCELVYVVSLNEGDFDRVQNGESPKYGVHFWLLPRYQHDEGFLTQINKDGTDNDGFALMAHWRKQFLLRSNSGKLFDFQKPKKEFPEQWGDYAQRTRADLRKAAQDLGLYE